MQNVIMVALDKLAPLTTHTRRSPRTTILWLSGEAVEVKRLRRRLERRWKQGRDESDRIAYRLQCRLANKLINNCRRNYYRHLIEQAASCKDKWKLTKLLLHSNRPSVVRSDDENNTATLFQIILSTKLIAKLQ